jgi:hypothetical protein
MERKDFVSEYFVFVSYAHRHQSELSINDLFSSGIMGNSVGIRV